MAKRKKQHKRSPSPTVKLSQCMIVKNEEKHIERALRWGKGIVSEQIVVDTGSTDRTVELAKRMGAKVLHFEWIDDFSAAKNFAIEQARGNWIAFLDADEYFTESDAKILIPYLKALISNAELNRKCLAVGCQLVEVNEAGEPEAEIGHVRIFRNTPSVRYHGRIHENLSIQARDIVRTSDFKVIHTGYSDDVFREKDKAKRNIDLLRMELASKPDNVTLKAYLASTLIADIVIGADKNATFEASDFAEAEKLYKEVLDSGEAIEPLLKKEAYLYFLGKYSSMHRNNPDFTKIREKAFSEFPDDKEIMSYAAVQPTAQSVASSTETTRSQFEKEAAALVALMRDMIEAGQTDGAAELLSQYSLLNPSDPQIAELNEQLRIKNSQFTIHNSQLLTSDYAGDRDGRPYNGTSGTPSPTVPYSQASYARFFPIPSTETIYILSGIITKRTGFFNSIFGKIKMMEEKLGYQSTILTYMHDIDLRKTEVWLKTFVGDQKILSSGAKVINVYEHFQKSYAQGLENKAVYEQRLGEAVQGDDGLRYVRNSGDSYDVYDGENLVRQDFYTGYAGSLRLQRHYKGGEKEKDCCFDDWGYLNYIREYDSGAGGAYHVKYFTTEGKVCIEASYKLVKEDSELQKLLVFDDNGGIRATLSDNAELAALCLSDMMADDRFYFLVFEDGLTQKTAGLIDKTKKNVATAAVVHTIFWNDAYDPSSGPQRFYVHLCNNPSDFDAIVMLTQTAKDDFARTYGYLDRIFVIPHPYPYEIVQNSFSGRDARKAVIISRLMPEKQINVAVDIFSRVVQKLPDAQLEIYGRGTEEERLSAQIKALGMENNVRLMGYTDDALALYRQAVLFMMTSYAEGYGLTVMEAICNGCPAFAFDTKYGPSDIIADGKTGFLFHRTDGEGFAKKMIEYLSDENMQRQMSENCYADAPRFGKDRFLESWLGMTETLYKIKN